MNSNLLLKIFIIIYLFLFSLIANAQNETPKDSISKELQEVIVKQHKKAFTNNNGNIKVDVANSIYNTIPNPVDLLAKLPLVQVSSDREKITLVGKGNPLIYIDNQKAEMSDLNALAVSDIKTIEIIQNPSSKYEASGRAVILITRKLSKKDSFRTEISEMASFKKNYNNYLGFNSNFKKNKVELKANFNYNRRNPWENHSIAYEIPQASIVSNYDVTADSKVHEYIFGGGLFYKINEDDYFSINASGKLRHDTFPINTFTYDKNQDEENNVLTWSDNTSKKNFVNAFINYSKKLKFIDTKLFTGFQYSNFNQHLWSLVENKFNETEFELSQNRDQKFNVDVFSSRIDLEKKFKNEMNWEYGGLYLQAKSKSDVSIFNYDENENAISNYNFKEQNTAGYTQLSGKIKKMDFSVGLRVENTNVSGVFKSQSLPVLDKNYTNLFPKAQFTVPIDSTKSISLNYAKSIVRPNYSRLSQISTYINPYFLYGNSMNIDPAVVDEISSTFQYHDKTVKLSYYGVKNPMYSSFIFNKETNVLTISEVNFNKETGVSLDFELPFSYKFWTTTNSLVFYLEKVEDQAAVFMKSKPYVYYYSNNEFDLTKGYKFVIGWWGATKQYKGIYEHGANFIMDMSLAKTFKNWNCTLSFNDLFRTTIYKEQLTINDVNSKSRYLVDAREISIAVRYTFGKVKNSDYKEKSINENESRIR
ncbi:outer membrane beta-barrel family protein [Flavobacterium hungaricum]|uniref:TonB-dependent receptor n=1 Tax=Flavobacterium hungaricum TaxID=2082725 RepID=A0ABR9TS55_9FLAO|nr:outer membrane beta-barrel family protein [Flavobacterium hungaricum]MBE8728168.1 TonB-dependent receptor [Flavobacterium hungaricum]